MSVLFDSVGIEMLSVYLEQSDVRRRVFPPTEGYSEQHYFQSIYECMFKFILVFLLLLLFYFKSLSSCDFLIKELYYNECALTLSNHYLF